MAVPGLRDTTPELFDGLTGGTLATRYRSAKIKDGDDHLVVITHPDQIASGPFQGVDTAKDQTCG